MQDNGTAHMSLKERLYLPPIGKYKKYRIFPWEILVSVLLILFSTCQVILIIQMSSTYSYAQTMQWNQIFLNEDRYYDLNNYTFDNYKFLWRKGLKKPPQLLINYINDGSTNGHKYDREYSLTRIDLGPLKRENVKDFMNIVEDFEIRFILIQNLPTDMPVAEDCYEWHIRQKFDFTNRGPIQSSQQVTRMVCDDNWSIIYTANVWSNYIWICYFLGITSLCSLLLVWNSFRERMQIVSKLKSVNSWRDLEFSEKAKFFNFSNIITIAGNICQFFSKPYIGFLIAVSNPALTFATYDVLAGIGCFCAWVNIVGYLDHTSESFMLVNTLKRSYNILLLYMLGLFPIYLAYAHLGMTLFWQTGCFMSLLDSMMILFAQVNGDSIYLFFSAGMQFNYILSQLYFYSFVVLFIWCAPFSVVQNTFISIIGNAFETLKSRPVKEVYESDEEKEGAEEEVKSPDLPAPLFRRATIRRNTKQELDRIKSEKIFKHLIFQNLSKPFKEAEENSDRLAGEMEDLANEISKLMYDIRDKALEDPKDQQAVVRFKEIIQVDLPKLFQDTLMSIS